MSLQSDVQVRKLYIQFCVCRAPGVPRIQTIGRGSQLGTHVSAIKAGRQEPYGQSRRHAPTPARHLRREGGGGDGSPNAPPRRHDRVMRECGGGLRPGECGPDAHGARAEPRAEENKDQAEYIRDRAAERKETRGVASSPRVVVDTGSAPIPERRGTRGEASSSRVVVDTGSAPTPSGDHATDSGAGGTQSEST